MLEDPRKDKYLKHSSGYSSYIYNCMVYTFKVANRDLDYLQLPLIGHFVDRAVTVSSKDAKDIGESTRMQAKSKAFSLFDKRK